MSTKSAPSQEQLSRGEEGRYSVNRCRLLCAHLGLIAADGNDKVAVMERGPKLARNVNSLDRTHEVCGGVGGVDACVDDGTLNTMKLSHDRAPIAPTPNSRQRLRCSASRTRSV